MVKNFARLDLLLPIRNDAREALAVAGTGNLVIVRLENAFAWTLVKYQNGIFEKSLYSFDLLR